MKRYSVDLRPEIFASFRVFRGPILLMRRYIASDRVLSGSGASPPFGTTEACRQKMQRPKLFCAGRMNIAKEQHVFESILTPSLITASAFECLRIFERAKEHVP